MALTNAERQARYRERLKAAARGEDLADRVRGLIMTAARICWTRGRELDVGMAEFETPDALVARFAESRAQEGNGHPAVLLRRLFELFLDEVVEPDRAVLIRAIDVLDVVSLHMAHETPLPRSAH